MRAAPNNFPQGTVSQRGYGPGDLKRRESNCVKALHCFFSQGLARLKMALRMWLSNKRSTAQRMSSVFMGLETQGAVSNLNVGGVL